MPGFDGIASAVSNLIGAGMASREASKNRKAQYDFAQRSIQWRVADAQKAGIHPLYALGATGSMYSPVSSSAPDFAAAAGQDISRAVYAGLTRRERRAAEHSAVVRQQMEDDMTMQRHGLDMERGRLENTLLASQIARLNSAQAGAPAPDAEPGSVDILPDQVGVGSVGAPERSPGRLTDYSFGHVAGGRYSIVPSSDMKQRVEDMPSEWQWFLRNGIVPDSSVFDSLTRQHPPRSGYRWRYNPITGEFFQQRIGRWWQVR